MAKRKLNVAMIGYDFMGRAHSNAWRQVGRFFQDAPFDPVLKVVVGRTEAKVKEDRKSTRLTPVTDVSRMPSSA